MIVLRLPGPHQSLAADEKAVKGRRVQQGPGGTFCPIVWGSRRQQHVARSTAGAELNALSEGVFEDLLPTYQLLQKLLHKPPVPVSHEDNSAVTQAIKKGYSVKLRHLARTPRLALSSLHETLTWMTLVQEPTSAQLADIMTKALPPKRFNQQWVGMSVWQGAWPSLELRNGLLGFQLHIS